MPPDTVNYPSGESVQEQQVTATDAVAKKSLRWYEFETEIKWGNAIFIVTLHTISLYTFITFPYFQHKFLVFWAWFMYHLTGIGTTAGAHRLWTHRAYKANIPARILLATFYYSAGMNSIYNWVRDHRVHHKYTDTEADPHDTSRGFFFSHVGWLMLKKKPEVLRRGNSIDMSDIVADPVVQFFDNNYTVLNTFLTFVLPVLIPVYIFNQDVKWSIMSQVFMRYPWLLNTVWSINSFAHMYGYHSYDKSIRPAENVWLSFVGGGEGWHNYHHVFPWDYKAAEFSNLSFNVTALWIEMFAQFGWASDLKQISPEHIKKVVGSRGDGTHPKYSVNTPPKEEYRVPISTQ